MRLLDKSVLLIHRLAQKDSEKDCNNNDES